MAEPATNRSLSVSVGNPDIDAVHEEMAVIAQQLAGIEDDGFAALFQQLISHTEQHFRLEEEMMQASGFPHSDEHRSEHKQMLAEMHRFAQRHPSMARAYAQDRLPERLNLHITRMDSLLAAYLRS